MDSKTKYRLADRKRQKRLQQLAADPFGLSREIAVARLLLEESLQGSPHLTRGLLETVGKLVGEHLANEIRMRRLISVDDLRDFAGKIGESIARHLEHVPDHEDIVDKIADDFAAGLVQLQKPTVSHPLLEGPPNARS